MECSAKVSFGSFGFCAICAGGSGSELPASANSEKILRDRNYCVTTIKSAARIRINERDRVLAR
jgi:hypothetical protein